MPTALEIKAAKAAILTSVLVLTLTFVAGGIYRQHAGQPERAKPLAGSDAIVAQGRTFFVKSCAHCHGKDADGGEDAPSLRKLTISPAHMTLVIESGIKGDMPSFAKKILRRRYRENCELSADVKMTPEQWASGPSFILLPLCSLQQLRFLFFARILIL